MRAADLRTVLRGRDFRRLYATRLVSQLTDGVFQFALAGYVFFSPERQTSAARAATAFAVLLLPYSVIGPFVGVFIDRWSRRQILVWAPAIRAALLILIAGLLVSDQDGAPFLLIALLVFGVNRFFLAALSAALPHVVRQELLVTANSFAVTSGTIVAFVGGGAGFLLRAAFGGGHGGTALILLCAAGSYLLAAATATTLHRDQLGPDVISVSEPDERGVERAAPPGGLVPSGEGGRRGAGSPRGHMDETSPPRALEELGGVVRALAEGVRYIWRCRPAALGLGVLALHRFLYGVVLLMTLLLCRNTFTTDPDRGLNKLILMLTVTGAGFLLAALITPVVVRRISKNAWIVALLAAAAGTLLLLGTPFVEAPWLVAAFVLGVVSQGIKLCVDTIIQESVDDAYRGRVFAVHDMLFNALFVAAAAVAAVTVPASGRSYTVLGALIAAYVVGALGYRRAIMARVNAGNLTTAGSNLDS